MVLRRNIYQNGLTVFELSSKIFLHENLEEVRFCTKNT